MNKRIIISVLILVVCNGEHPTPILDAIIGGATRIRERLQGASSLIGSLTHGHRGVLDIGGGFQFNKEPPQPPRRPGLNGYGPGPNGYGTGSNGYGPGPNGNGDGPNVHGPGPNGYGPGPSGYGPGPNGNGPGPNEYPGRPGYNHGAQNNNQYQHNRPNYEQNNQGYDSDKKHSNAVENTKQENMPHYNNAHDYKKPTVDGQITHGGTKNEDGPIRVPLNPNEVNYGGDKTETNAPKRETKNDEAADDDQEYNIDVRFNNHE